MKTGKPLPKTLPGAIVAQYRSIEGKTYGPYWFRFWRADGRLRKAYVRPGELERVRQACEAHRLLRAGVAFYRRQRRANRSDLALLARLLRRAAILGPGDEIPTTEAERARLARMSVGRGR